MLDQAYCIYCYFALLVLYCGGKERVLMYMRESEVSGCQSCANNTPECCYETINVCVDSTLFPGCAWIEIRVSQVLLLQFMIVRPIFNVFYAITELNGHENVALRTVRYAHLRPFSFCI